MCPLYVCVRMSMKGTQAAGVGDRTPHTKNQNQCTSLSLAMAPTRTIHLRHTQPYTRDQPPHTLTQTHTRTRRHRGRRRRPPFSCRCHRKDTEKGEEYGKNLRCLLPHVRCGVFGSLETEGGEMWKGCHCFKGICILHCARGLYTQNCTRFFFIHG